MADILTEAGRIVKMEVDYATTCDEKIPECEKLAKSGQLNEAIEALLSLEKQTRTVNKLSVIKVTETKHFFHLNRDQTWYLPAGFLLLLCNCVLRLENGNFSMSTSSFFLVDVVS
jgi:hypothetical protein